LTKTQSLQVLKDDLSGLLEELKEYRKTLGGVLEETLRESVDRTL
jgi:hypothetical protein